MLCSHKFTIFLQYRIIMTGFIITSYNYLCNYILITILPTAHCDYNTITVAIVIVNFMRNNSKKK